MGDEALASKPETPEFLSGIEDDEIKGSPSLAKFKDIGGLAKSYIELEKMNGNTVRIPADDATDEDRAKFYSKLGRPDKPEYYELTAPAGVEVNADIDKGYRETAHKLGLSTSQAKGVYDWFHTQVSEITSANRPDGDATLKQLQSDWGIAYDENLALAQRAYSKFASPKAVEILDKTGLGNDPEMVKLFLKIGNALKEDESFNAEPAVSVETQQDAQAEIERIKKDLKHPSKDPAHPDFKKAQEELRALYEMAYPTQKPE